MARNLQHGSRGADVLELERRLDERGYYVGDVDEEFDEHTDAAVRYYQSVSGLSVDGIAGPITQAALEVTTEGDGSDGDGEGGEGGVDTDVTSGVRILSLEADSERVTWRAQAYGDRSGPGEDNVIWASADGAYVSTSWNPFDIPAGETYDAWMDTPADMLEYWNAAPGRDLLVTVVTNTDGPGETDTQSVQVLGWSGGA